ncbi:hypothetical protein U1Q18_017482, partial [Sarracenia purpurea var. burkii]
SDELAYASEEHADTVSNMGNKDALRSKGTNSVVDQLSRANSSHIIYGDEFDTTVTMLNMAVIWFHDHEYARAYSILDSLYQKIEPIDKATAILICLLFLDVTLASHDLWRFVMDVEPLSIAYYLSIIFNMNWEDLMLLVPFLLVV